MFLSSTSVYDVTFMRQTQTSTLTDIKYSIHRSPNRSNSGTMAMLAEPRRKQKWSVDPRNSTWSKDESKVGQKMLEKMGWSKGKGLGAKEQGSTEHIKVQVKNNTMGLGASVNNEDNWVAHQDDFNQILAELNNCHGTASSESPGNDSKKSFSLEEKSKASKKRVHYMKFAKGKDLSCRSDTDLACIFGKREKVKKATEEEAEVSPEECEGKKSPSPTTEVDPGNTVTSSLSVNEYFAKRMAELKKSRARHTELALEKTEPNPADGIESSSKEIKKKSKKKQRCKTDSNSSLDCPAEPALMSNGDGYATESREPRKKSKSEDMQHSEDQEEEQAQGEKLKKMKKKNKRKKKMSDWNEKEEENPDQSEENYTVKPKKKKKEKSKD
ncbi:PIN2/TERF1-interacting telomerase inhibitor 1 [Mixophyes fleayi]|uniref:PIN2/TERF1-interacting telomerase inhibitor 1 n=1 Tax=Mixophyes fleayi TaxID=3061075 RepID=UPI003F4D81A3